MILCAASVENHCSRVVQWQGDLLESLSLNHIITLEGGSDMVNSQVVRASLALFLGKWVSAGQCYVMTHSGTAITSQNHWRFLIQGFKSVTWDLKKGTNEGELYGREGI